MRYENEQAIKENTAYSKFSTEAILLRRAANLIDLDDTALKTKEPKPKKIKEEAKENPVQKTLEAYSEIKKESKDESKNNDLEVSIQSVIALAKTKMNEGISRSDIKKKITELGAEQILDLTEDKLIEFHSYLQNLKVA